MPQDLFLTRKPIVAAADGRVVGTHFEEGGDTWQPVDDERVRRFMARVRELR